MACPGSLWSLFLGDLSGRGPGHPALDVSAGVGVETHDLHI